MRSNLYRALIESPSAASHTEGDARKEVNAMQIKKTIIAVAAALLVSGASLGGVAVASSDGPGGHEDPLGNVEHQFEGEE